MALSSVPSIRLPPCLSGAARRTSIEAFPDVDEWDGLLLGDAEKMHDVALLDSSGCGSGYHFEDGWQHDRSVLRTVHHRILVGLVVLAATHISDTDRLAIFEDDGTDALNHIPGPPRGPDPCPTSSKDPLAKRWHDHISHRYSEGASHTSNTVSSSPVLPAEFMVQPKELFYTSFGAPDGFDGRDRVLTIPLAPSLRIFEFRFEVLHAGLGALGAGPLFLGLELKI